MVMRNFDKQLIHDNRLSASGEEQVIILEREGEGGMGEGGKEGGKERELRKGKREGRRGRGRGEGEGEGEGE